jgi:glycosyltransferase involved in cell wall biosynthesis
MIAHLGPQKDHLTLVDAASILVKKIPEVIFILIGGNMILDKQNFRGEIEKYIKKKELENNFYFVGEVINPFPYIELFDVGCLISNFEGFGNALVEYMLKKKPIIGTSVGGIKDIIEDGYNGFLVPPKKPEIIAGKLIYFYENPSIVEEMGKRGYQKAITKYNMDNWINRIIELYKN